MVDKIVIAEPKNFAELLQAVEDFQAKSAISWYRGCRDVAHKLRPTLYRHSTKTDIAEIAILEEELTTRFVQRSLPFLQRSLTNEWDKLFLMQHYGVPTRLLDWSENPFVSMYFSLVSASEKQNTDASLWMCDPIAWNRAALEHISFKGGVLDESNTIMRGYAPGTPVKEMPMLPIMVYGSYNSPRIVAQRGGFALFGQSTSPMDDVYQDAKFPKGILMMIKISHQYVEDIKASLFRKGFTESVVFPDLDGLSRELKRTFGFK